MSPLRGHFIDWMPGLTRHPVDIMTAQRLTFFYWIPAFASMTRMGVARGDGLLDWVPAPRLQYAGAGFAGTTVRGLDE
jgi:hypothetical protein